MDRGISDVQGFLNKLLQDSPIRIGRGGEGLFAVYLYEGKEYLVAYGDNGYIV